MITYEIKIPTTADIREIFFNRNTNKLSYKNDLGIVTAIVGESGTTATVNITATQILAMGTTPIELLPAPGVGMYYDIEKVVLEYTHLTTSYDLEAGNLINVRSSDNWKYIGLTKIGALQTQNRVTTLILTGAEIDNTNNFVQGGWRNLNTSIILDTYYGTNPTLGNGTLRVKIYYKTITFGA